MYMLDLSQSRVIFRFNCQTWSFRSMVSQGVGCQLTRVVLVQNGLQSVTYRGEEMDKLILRVGQLAHSTGVCLWKEAGKGKYYVERTSLRGAQLADLSAQLLSYQTQKRICVTREFSKLSASRSVQLDQMENIQRSQISLTWPFQFGELPQEETNVK